MARIIAVSEVLDRQPLRAAHIGIVLLLTITMLVDGYDVSIVGDILPAMAKGLDVPPQALTSNFVVQQFGMFIGTFLVGPVVDRFGRRRVLLICLGVIAALTYVTSHITAVWQLDALRFTTGLFLAGVIPACISLASEIAPARYKAAFVTVIFIGYTMGNLVAAWVQGWALSRFGWESAFLIGAVLPFALVFLLTWKLPESILFLAHRNPADPRIGHQLKRLDPTLELDGTERFVLDQAHSAKAPAGATRRGRFASVVSLFQHGQLRTTLLLWAGYSMAFMVTHILSSWRTTYLHVIEGITIERIALITAFSVVASILGLLTSGLLIDRFGAHRMIPFYFLGSAVAIASVGLVDLHTWMLFVPFLAVAFFGNSAVGGLNAFATMIYPTSSRATGVSWGAGAGRLGGMIGPAIGGLFLTWHWGISTIYFVTAIPMLIAALVLHAIRVTEPEEILSSETAAPLAAVPAPAKSA